MAWVTPPVFTSGEVLTAALLNELSTDIGGWATPASFAPANPTGTTSTTGVMMGLGTTITFTPLLTGNIKVALSALVGTNTASANITVQPKYGSGPAPANGAAPTGTSFGPFAASQFIQSLPGARVGWSTPPLRIPNLVVGTAYWFDVELATASASDQALFQYVMATVEECL